MTDEKQTTNIDIQPETNKRARYSAGMRLNATDLTTDQTYFLGKDYTHNQSLHGYGTVHGLEVSYVTKETDGEKNLIKVAPGMGIDRLGRAFTVDQVYCADLDAFLAQKPSDYKDGAPIYVVGYFAEKAEEERPVAAVLGACGGEESSQGGSAASRVVDSFCLKLMATRPEMPLWEATRVFYDGLKDPMKLDEAYRQWVKEKLPNLRKEEAETLGQTDGAAILLGKVALTRDDDEDEGVNYPRAEEDDRPYLLHTQLIQGLRGGNATEVEYAKRADIAGHATTANVADHAMKADFAREAGRASQADLSAFATHTSRIVPFVTITPGTYDPGDSTVTQSFEFWFHLDVVLTENGARFSESGLDEIDKPVPVTAYSEVNGGGLNQADIVAIRNSRLTPVRQFANVYRAMLRFQEDLETPPPFLRFVFDLTKVKVSNNQGQEQPILAYMRVNALNFEGFWSDPPGAPVDGQAGAVVVYVRNTDALDVNDLMSLSAPLRDQIVTPAAPAKRSTLRKRSGTSK